MNFVCVSATPHMAFDRKKDKGGSAESLFIRARKVERSYERQLRKIAKYIGDLVSGMYDPTKPFETARIVEVLNRYADTLADWAESVASRMIADVSRRTADRKAWMEMSSRIGKGIREEIDTSPTGSVMRQRLDDQTKLIKSLPTDAAERVRQITLEGISGGKRAEVVAKEIMASGQVSKSRATLIARTEVARTATELTRARAEAVGSIEFVWRTVGDSDVRPSHRKLNGKTFRWDTPPECDPGHHALPGAIWNCRCYPEPLFPDE